MVWYGTHKLFICRPRSNKYTENVTFLVTIILNKRALLSRIDNAVRTALNESLFDDEDFVLDDSSVISAEMKPQWDILRQGSFEDRLKEIFD